MTLTTTRLARLGSPQRGTAPRSPMCSQCTTDLYLKIRLFLPASRSRTAASRLRRAIGRVIRSAGPSGGRVEYFCQKCGTQQRHPIPEGWEPTGKALTPCDVRELSSIYITPGESLPAEALGPLPPEPEGDSSEPASRAEKTLAVHSAGPAS